MEAYLRVIDQPVLRLVSVDLQATAEIASIDEIFDFARDYLALLKAAVIASGLVPPGMEGAAQPLADLLERLTGRARPGHRNRQQSERHSQRFAPGGFHHVCWPA